MFFGRPSLFELWGGWDFTVKWGFHLGVSKNNGTPKSSILIGFFLINHPFWGTPIFGNTHFKFVEGWRVGSKFGEFVFSWPQLWCFSPFFEAFSRSHVANCYTLVGTSQNRPLENWRFNKDGTKTKQHKEGRPKQNKPTKTNKESKPNQPGHHQFFFWPFCRSFSTWGRRFTPFSDGSFLLQPCWIFHWTMAVYQRVHHPKTNMTREDKPLKMYLPFKNGDFPLLWYQRVHVSQPCAACYPGFFCSSRARLHLEEIFWPPHGILTNQIQGLLCQFSRCFFLITPIEVGVQPQKGHSFWKGHLWMGQSNITPNI